MKYTSAITKIKYVFGGIVLSNIKLQNLVMLAYAPDEGKPAYETDKFYEDLQDAFCKISNN